jgi:hypothetical protein
VLWEDEVQEGWGHLICVGIDLFSFMFRSIMTHIMASSEDLDRLGEFLEGARLVFFICMCMCMCMCMWGIRIRSNNNNNKLTSTSQDIDNENGYSI